MKCYKEQFKMNWGSDEDYEWDMNYAHCFAVEPNIIYAHVKEPPPRKCPYVLEHTVMEQQDGA